jgi:hypothetical protein
MAIKVNQDGTLSIVTMSLVEMLPLVVQAVHDGYKLDLNTNLGCPQVLGSLHLLTMFPTQADSAVEAVPTSVTEAVETPVKVEKVDGRKKQK